MVEGKGRSEVVFVSPFIVKRRADAFFPGVNRLQVMRGGGFFRSFAGSSGFSREGCFEWVKLG